MMFVKTCAVVALCFAAVVVSASSDIDINDNAQQRFKELFHPEEADAPRNHAKMEKPLVLSEKPAAAPASSVLGHIEQILGAEPAAAHDPPARDPDNPLANEGLDNSAEPLEDNVQMPRFVQRLSEEGSEESGAAEDSKHDNLPHIPGLKLERATVMNPIDSPHAKKGLSKLAAVLAAEPEVARIALPGEEDSAGEPSDNEQETEGLTVGFIEKEAKLVKPVIMDPTQTAHVQSALSKIQSMLDKEPAAARVPIAGEPHRTNIEDDPQAEEKMIYPLGQNEDLTKPRQQQ